MNRAVAIVDERFGRVTILRLPMSGSARFDEGTRPRSREALERGER